MKPDAKLRIQVNTFQFTDALGLGQIGALTGPWHASTHVAAASVPARGGVRFLPYLNDFNVLNRAAEVEFNTVSGLFAPQALRKGCRECHTPLGHLGFINPDQSEAPDHAGLWS